MTKTFQTLLLLQKLFHLSDPSVCFLIQQQNKNFSQPNFKKVIKKHVFLNPSVNLINLLCLYSFLNNKFIFLISINEYKSLKSCVWSGIGTISQQTWASISLLKSLLYNSAFIKQSYWGWIHKHTYGGESTCSCVLSELPSCRATPFPAPHATRRKHCQFFCLHRHHIQLCCSPDAIPEPRTANMPHK